MKKPADEPLPADRSPVGFRDLRPTLFLGLWLAAFWFLSPDFWHRCLLGWLVIPSIIPAIAKPSRWLWLAATLLGWQTLSRLWSGGGDAPPGWWLDSLLVFGLLCALNTAARGPALKSRVFPALSFVSAAVAAVSLTAFYQAPGHNLADDRLRNVFFYDHGLNAVPTGFLFAFGALAGAWHLTRPTNRRQLIARTAATALSVLGLLATQSRGPMLMFAIGLLCLLAFERKRALPALATTAAATVAFFTLLLVAQAGRHAALDLVQRGSTGRLEIYHWFLTHISSRELLIGTGIARPPVLPEEILGWRVTHPHSIYLTQLYQTGIPGATLLLALIATALKSALSLARRGESLWLCLLAGAAVALLFDGGQVFTVYSVARIEILLIAVPAAIAVERARQPLNGGTSQASRPGNT